MALQMTGSWFIYHWHQEGCGCLRPVGVEKLGYVMMAIVSSARRRSWSRRTCETLVLRDKQ